MDFDSDIATAVAAELNELPDRLRLSGLAASALTLAHRLDGAAHRDSSALARELRATLADLRQLAAAEPAEADPVDELAAKRAARLAGAALPQRAAAADQRGTGDDRTSR